MQPGPDLLVKPSGDAKFAALQGDFVKWLMTLDEDQVSDAARQLLAQRPAGVPERLFVRNLVGSVDISLEHGEMAAAGRALAMVDAIAHVVDQDWAYAESDYWRAQIELRQGAPESAAASFHRAAERAQEPEMKALALTNEGNALLTAGDLIGAEQRFGEALQLAKSTNDAAAATHASLGMARIADARNQPEQIRVWLDRARQQAAGRPELDLYVAGLAHLHTKAGRPDAAMADQRRFADLVKLSGGLLPSDQGARAAASALSNEVVRLMRDGDAAKALQMIPQLLATHEHLTPRERVDDLLIISTVYQDADDRQAMKQQLLTAVRLCEQFALEEALWQASGALAVQYALEGLFEPAYRMGAKAIEAIERMRGRAGDTLLRLGFVLGKTDFYDLMVDVCLVLGELRREPVLRNSAFEYVERAKSRTLVDLLGLVPIPVHHDVPAALGAAEVALVGELRSLEAVLVGEANPSEAQSLRDRYRQTRLRLDAVEQQISVIAPEYTAVRRGETVGPGEIRVLLGGRLETDVMLAALPVGARNAAPSETQGWADGGPVHIVLQAGSSFQVAVGTTRDAQSYAAVFDELDQASSPAALTRAVITRMAVFDAGWWSFFEKAITQFRASRGDASVFPLVMRGKYICDHVLIHGSERQLLAASQWWNVYLVASIRQLVGQCAFDNNSLRQIRAALPADRAAPAAAADLATRWPDLRRESTCPRLLDVLLQNTSWIDQYFFEELSRTVRRFQEESHPELAAACFIAGALAAASVHAGTSDQSKSGAAFLERFPEERFRT